jgi:hypothetical protein
VTGSVWPEPILSIVRLAKLAMPRAGGHRSRAAQRRARRIVGECDAHSAGSGRHHGLYASSIEACILNAVPTLTVLGCRVNTSCVAAERYGHGTG